MTKKAAATVYKFQYAIKFTYKYINSNFPLNPPFVYGGYLTQVSIHNFHTKPVKIRKKIAAPDKISPFINSTIKPDAVEDVNYSNLNNFTYPFPPTGFFDGFLVIESQVELDVVVTNSSQLGALIIKKADAREGSWS